MANFDFDKFAEDPRVLLGIGLLSARTPQEGIAQGMGLLSQRKRQQQEAEANQLDRLYKQMQMEEIQRKARYENLPSGYEMGPDGTARLIPGVDPSYGRKMDPYAYPMPVYNPATGQQEFQPRGALAGGNFQPPGAAPAKPKPLPASALKLQQDSLDALGTAEGIQSDLGAFETQIKEGKLDLGPINNKISEFRNYISQSTPESRNYGSFKTSLEKLRNDSLRLNKGVQTDGDAQRAWNELMGNLNDNNMVVQRLGEIQKINERGATLQKLNIDTLRENFGAEPMDYDKRTNLPPVVGGGDEPPPASMHPGKIIRNPATGQRLKSDGKQWNPL